MPVTFTATDGRYTFGALDGLVTLIVDRVRRERHTLVGELEVRCEVAGARTYGDQATLLVTTLNLSNARARQDVGRLLAERARTDAAIDWTGYLEDFSQRIWAHERQGQPSEWLHKIPPTAPDATATACGFSILKHHPQIIFAPGGTGKSLLGAALLGDLGRYGLRTLVLDFEMDGGEYRLRGDALDLPQTIRYRRCDQPLVVLADSIRRDVVDHQIDFLLIDSVAPACPARVEDAEVAIEFFKAWRRIGVGGIAIAHTRAEDGEQRPFGSIFWHNLARATWFLKRVDEHTTPTAITLGIYHRKANFGPLRPPFGLEMALEQNGDVLQKVTVRHIDVADVHELAPSLPLWQRMKHALRGGAKTIAELATELDSKPDTVKKALGRDKGRAFVLVSNTDDGIHRWALIERRAS
jgi:hypothetical protein